MTSPPYQTLAAVYDRWLTGHNYAAWIDFIVQRLGGSARTVLDLCCGTGVMIHGLQERGYTMTGLDRSPEMLARARAVTAPGTQLIHGEIPDTPVPGGQDGVICCFDSVNYFVDPDALDGLFATAAAALRPAGLFIFDVNTEFKLVELFGSSHHGDDLGDFAYVWRNRCRPAERQIEFHISLFVRNGDHFFRSQESHVQRWFGHDELRAVAARHGFAVCAIGDDYSERPVGRTTQRETWVLRAAYGTSG